VSHDAELAFAHRLADAADAITLDRFRALDLAVDTKPDRTPVTDADRATEKRVRDLIARERPGEGVLGEEFGDDGSATRWIVDPIDGTMNFLRGVPVWATLLAFERDGRVEVGLVSAPALGRRWWALRGEGTWANGARCRVSQVARIEDCVASTTSPRGLPEGWTELVARAWAIRGLSDFWQHCLVAEGALDVAVDGVVALWDYAGIALIVEEAGGRCTTFEGGEPTPEGSLLSTNGALHDAASHLLRA
jgi:histidinol-phosphatase